MVYEWISLMREGVCVWEGGMVSSGMRSKDFLGKIITNYMLQHSNSPKGQNAKNATFPSQLTYKLYSLHNNMSSRILDRNLGKHTLQLQLLHLYLCAMG